MRKIISLLTILCFTSPVFAFQDTSNSRYSQAIDELKQRNIIKGDDGKNTFRPLDNINRAEITKIIVLATNPQNLDQFNQSCFPDVQANQWYTPYICYAKTFNWVKGYTDGTFKPERNVSNFEAMKIAAISQNIQFTENNPWYKNLVNVLSQHNLIPEDIHTPHASLNREQMAELINRIYHFNQNNLLEYLGERSGLNVTLETIEEGINLTEFRTIKLQ